jgi:type I restriction enzyme S subunit
MSEYPSDWRECLLGEVVEKITSGGTPKADNPDLYGGDIPFLKIDDITSSSKYLRSHKVTINERGLSESSAKIVPTGTLLLTMYGTIGRCCITTYPVATNQAIASFLGHPEVELEYLYYALESKADEFATASSQTTQANISEGILKQTPLAIPPLPEQKKIAEILSGIDFAISGIQRKIDKLRSAKVALAESELMGQRHDNHTNSEIGYIPSHWQVKGILEVSSVASGQVDPTSKEYRDMILIAPNHIESGTGKIIGKETAIQQAAISGKYFAKLGSVILSKIRPNLAKVCMADQDCLTSADMYPLTAMHGITPAYLKQVLLSKRFTKYATESSVRGNIPKINREELSGYKFALPPLDEQMTITSGIESIETIIRIEEERVGLLLALKNSLSSDLLTGRKMVSV